MALIRYPGSKEKITNVILERFPDAMRFGLWSASRRMEYREPFFGAGAMGFKVLKRLHPDCRVWINDKDSGVAALWSCVKDCPDDLIDRIDGYTPTAEDFHRYKAEDGIGGLDDLERGFRKLAMHQMSYSGLGAMAGGPLGGKDQDNAQYPVDCRWNPEALKEDIRELNRIIKAFDAFQITCGDFAPLIETADEDCFLYVDPPYYEQGPKLYKHGMGDDQRRPNPNEHARLARALKGCQSSWLLSYDDHPAIRDLYADCGIDEIPVTYTIAESREATRPKNKEIIIYPVPVLAEV